MNSYIAKTNLDCQYQFNVKVMREAGEVREMRGVTGMRGTRERGEKCEQCEMTAMSEKGGERADEQDK